MSIGEASDNKRRRLFMGCFISLIATAFGFAVRGAVLADWQKEFALTNEQLGYLGGVGLYPFAISIILLSMFIDRIGYGRAMVFAFLGHLVSTLIIMRAESFETLYWGIFLSSLANGTVEAVINPVVASMYDKNKTHWLNILHAGWPGGLVLGGLLSIGVSYIGTNDAPADASQPPSAVVAQADADAAVANAPVAKSNWRWQVGLVLLPTLIYGLLLLGQKFPVQERIKAGVSDMDMLREFGWGSAFICFTLLIAGVIQVLQVIENPALQTVLKGIPIWGFAAMALVPTMIYGAIVKSFGRPMFVFLLLVMFLLATTELGTDSWISDIMRAVFKGDTPTAASERAAAALGTLFLVYTSFIMFVLRFFAGPIVHRISPLGLLAVCSAVASVGLLWLSSAGNATMMLFLAATLYGFGKTFFWPTTLGVVSEQYPRGGALMLNAIAGVGMIAVGTIGNPAIGYFQDQHFSESLKREDARLHERVTMKAPGLFGESTALDQKEYAKLTPSDKLRVDHMVVGAKQGTLAKVAILPAIMMLCYLALIVYFRTRGGYQADVLTGHSADDEKYTGGVAGPVE